MAKCNCCGREMLTANGCSYKRVVVKGAHKETFKRIKVGDPGDWYEEFVGTPEEKDIANILTSCFELLISKSLKKTPLANAILVCTSFAPVTRKPSLTEAVSRFATAIMSWSSRKGRNTKFLILLTVTVSPMN